MECLKRIGAGVISYPCTLEKDHDGPHYAVENQKSIRERKAWQAERDAEDQRLTLPHPGAEPLSSFQGPPKSSRVGLMEHEGYIPTVDTQNPGSGRRVYTGQNPTTTIPTFWTNESPEDHFESLEKFEPTKQREGDQPLPTIHDGRAIQDMVIDDIEDRKAVGVERYGTTLQAFNDRDVNLDLYEELLDAAIYCRQLRVERKELLDSVVSLIENLESEYGTPLPPQLFDPLHTLYKGLYTV